MSTLQTSARRAMCTKLGNWLEKLKESFSRGGPSAGGQRQRVNVGKTRVIAHWREGTHEVNATNIIPTYPL